MSCCIEASVGLVTGRKGSCVVPCAMSPGLVQIRSDATWGCWADSAGGLDSIGGPNMEGV